jgi:hypothetical protein
VELTGAAEQFNEAAVPDLNRTPRSGDSISGGTQKTRQLPEESMPQPRTLFDEMAPAATTLDDPVRELSQCVRSPCFMRLTSGDS